MFDRMGQGLANWSLKWIPSPYIFTVILTLIVFIAGVTAAGESAVDMVLHWGGGFFDLLEFSMQMALVLVTGHVVASSKPVMKAIQSVSTLPNSSSQAVVMIALLAGICGWIHWGFGLIVGAILARDVARQGYLNGNKMHYPILAGAGYLGLMVWHGGFSGSAPLTVATEGHFLEEQIGIIPIAETLLTPFNLVVSGGLIIIGALFMYLLHPKNKDKFVEIDPGFVQELEEMEKEENNNSEKKSSSVPAEILENTPIFTILIGLAALYYIVWHFATQGFDLTLNIVIFIFLTLGIWFHWKPMNLVNAVGNAVKGIGGVVLLFPFYAGIQGMMADSGLVMMVAEWFAAVSTEVTYPFFTLISAALVNLFVPSGGGQWAVQGPIMMEAAPAIGVTLERTILSVAYGDQLTNMLQPFWAIALLGIVRLRARDIIGYTLGVMIFAFIFASLCVMFLPPMF